LLQYGDALREFSEALYELWERAGTLGKAERDSLRQTMVSAKVRLEEIKLLVDRHILAHKC
jgi:hypothetical protein